MIDRPRMHQGLALTMVGALLATGALSVLDNECVAAQPNPYGEVVGSVGVQFWGDNAYVAYDPVNGQVYVDSSEPAMLSSLGQNVTILNATTGKVVGSLIAGPGPAAMTVDPHGNLWVASQAPSVIWAWGRFNISEVSESTNAVLRSIPLDFVPDDLAYDPLDGAIDVGGEGIPSLANLTVIDAASGAIVGESPGEADAIGVDTATGSVLFSNMTAKVPTIEVMDALTHRITSNITTGTWPSGLAEPGMAYDPQTGDMFEAGVSASDYRDASFSVFNATTGTVLASDVRLPGGNGMGASIAYNPQNGHLYVLGWDCGGGTSIGGCVVVLDGRTHTVLGTIPVGEAPDGIAFDPVNGDLYIPDLGQARLWIVSTLGAPPPPLTTLPNFWAILLALALGGLLVAVGARQVWVGRKGEELRVPA